MNKSFIFLIGFCLPSIGVPSVIEAEVCHEPVWVKSCTLYKTNVTPQRVLGTVPATPYGNHSICSWDAKVLIPLGVGKHVLQSVATGNDGVSSETSKETWVQKWNNTTTKVSTYVISKPVTCNNVTKKCTDVAEPVCP